MYVFYSPFYGFEGSVPFTVYTFLLNYTIPYANLNLNASFFQSHFEIVFNSNIKLSVLKLN